jgi:pilus assembly protein CpaB
VVKAVTLEVNEIDGQKLALASEIGTLSLLLRKAGDVVDGKTRQIRPTDLRSDNSSLATVEVIRPTKGSKTEADFYSVPIERGAAPEVALSGQAAARN